LGSDDLVITGSVHAEAPPHPALRADLSPQAGRGEPAQAPELCYFISDGRHGQAVDRHPARMPGAGRFCEPARMNRFVERHPVWSLLILGVVVLALWLIFATWPQELEDVVGRKRVFLNALFNGITLGGLYFLVASGFTLIFGLMRNVNLAHGSIYLFGGYVGYKTELWTGSWLFSFVVAFIAAALLGIILQLVVFRRMEGQDLRQTLVTIGISIVLADLMLWGFGGDFYQVQTPDWLVGPAPLPFVTAIKSSGEVVYLQYPIVRLVIFAASVVIGVAMWLVLNRTRIGMMIRAGVDDRDMLSAMGVPIQLVFVLVFAFGAGLAGMAGVVGGTFQSISPGEDTRFLLASLVVVIVGGMGSIPGAALGALIIGLAEQLGSVYVPTYSVVLTFLIMVAVLALRPQGLLARR
jgi:branched-chain amino acid transport system permease protein